MEFDFVRADRNHQGRETAVVSEVKWKHLAPIERSQLEKRLEDSWQRCGLSARYKDVAFEVLDADVLKTIED